MKRAFVLLFAFVFTSQVVFASHFSDLKFSNGDFYQTPEIDWMLRNHIVEPADKFFPDRDVTRAEFLKMLYLTLGKDVSGDEGNISAVFSDVKSGEWYAKYVNQAYLDGLVNGYEDGNFRPEAPVNVAEASKIIGNGFFSYDGAYIYADLSLEDVNTHNGCVLQEQYYRGQWFWPYIYGLDHACIYPGTIIAEPIYHPAKNLTRMEMVLMLYASKSSKDDMDRNGVHDHIVLFAHSDPDDVYHAPEE